MPIALPTLGLAQAWVAGPDDKWHFDDPDGASVDKRRWGSGIPLLLSGPAARRPITDQATAQQLMSFGLSRPSMQVELGLVGNGPDKTLGNFDNARLADFIEKALPVFASKKPPADLKPEDLATNEFIDETIGL